MVFTVRGQQGRYKPNGEKLSVTGKHHTVDLSVYEWEQV